LHAFSDYRVEANMATFEFLPVDSLTLDIENPRISRIVEKYGNEPTPDQIYLALGAGAPASSSEAGPTFQSLKESIRTNKGVIHPIIVNKTEDGKLKVIEGNTRVAIYKEFKKKNIPGSWSTIPAIVHENLNKAAVDSIRLQAHLVGPRQWDPYSKAKYLNHLRNSEHLPLNQVIDYCGGKKQEVLTYIDAFNDMESYYKTILEDEADFDPTRFSAFVELQKPIIKQSIIDAGFSLTDFAKWVDTRLVYPLETVRDLPRILSNKESRSIFLKDGAKEALKVLIKSEGGDISNLSLDKLVKELITRLRSIQLNTIKDLGSDLESEKTRNIFDLRDELTETCSWIEKGGVG